MSNLEKYVDDFARTLPDEAILLDVGCGQKPYKSLFNHKVYYIGIDAFVSGRPGENKAQDIYFDGQMIPLKDNTVDAILCTQVLEHAKHAEKLLIEIYRVMKPGATALVTVPFIWGEHETPYDFRRFTSFGIKKLIEENHFTILSYEKSCTGINALQKIIFSELSYHKSQQKMPHSILEKLIDNLLAKISHKLILWLIKFLDNFYCFERIYIDNVISFKK